MIAAAVVDSAKRPVGALHVAASLSDWSVDDFRRLVAPLTMEAARALSGFG